LAKIIVRLLAANCGLILAAPAFAQEADLDTQARAKSQADEAGTIVVTATRRSESALDVPLSISAIGQRQLDTKGIKNVADLARMTAGVTFVPAWAGASNIAIRGVISEVGSGTTGIYIDDTPIQVRFLGQGLTSTNAYPYLFDLERVEVLRGPQGTLFGAGSEGGTVRFIAPEPSLDTFSGYVRAELGATDRGALSYEAGAAVGGPISSDRLGFRISAFRRRDGGWVDRVAYPAGPGATTVIDDNADATDTTVLRGALALAVSDRLTITPSVHFQETRRRDSNQYWANISAPDQGRFFNGQPLRQPGKDRFVLYTNKIQFDAGPVSIFSNTSFFDRRNPSIGDYSHYIGELLGFDYNASLDVGYTAPSFFDNGQKVFTQEVRIQSNTKASRLSWVIGGFYQNARQSARQTIVSDLDNLALGLFGVPAELAFGVGNLPGDVSYRAIDQARDRQLAGFGQVDYRIGKLTLTAGVRVARVKLDFSNSQVGPLNIGGDTGNAGSLTETPVTPKIGAQYKASERVLLYVSASKGFRNGGYNSAVPAVQCATDLAAFGLTQVPPEYRSDNVWSYEAGLKGQFLDRKLDIEGSVFRVDWNQIQSSVRLQNCGFNYVANLGSAKSQGFDLRVRARPATGLSLDIAVAYTDAKYRETVTSGAGAGAGVLIAAGDRLRVAPWHASLSADYQFPVSADGAVIGYANANYDFDSAFRYGPGPTTTFFDPVTARQASTSFASLRAGVRKDRYDLSLFAQNLFNSRSVTSITHDTLLTTLTRETTLRPLTVGLTVSARY